MFTAPRVTTHGLTRTRNHTWPVCGAQVAYTRGLTRLTLTVLPIPRRAVFVRLERRGRFVVGLLFRLRVVRVSLRRRGVVHRGRRRRAAVGKKRFVPRRGAVARGGCDVET